MRKPLSKESQEAVQALHEAIAVGLLVPRSKKPGAVIERLPASTREKLQKLTADDLNRFRTLGA